LPDPYLAIAEVLILVIAPILVLLMLAIHACAPAHAKAFTRVALGWMLAAAAFTLNLRRSWSVVSRSSWWRRARTVADLVGGPGIAFADRGTHTFKGVPTP
jgi:hypothetical protein